MADEATARAWLVEAGFAEGDLRSAIKIDQFTMCPMGWASKNGKLGVCRWLHENGAAADVTKAMLGGWTPMWLACREGHLSVCEWLFEVGTAADITKAINNGITLMWIACQEGQLPVCKWLFEVGAAADITKANNNGVTPMRAASDENHIPVQQWLVLKGALTSDNANGHTDDAIIRRDIPDADQRTALLEWAMELVAAHKEFKRTFLVGALSPQKSALLWKLGSLDDATNQHFKQLVADFAGVPYEREVRNAREAAEELATMMN